MPSINLKNNELDFTPTFGTQHPELCVPGKVDQEWRQISVGKIHFNPKYPSQQMQIELKPYFSDSQNI